MQAMPPTLVLPTPGMCMLESALLYGIAGLPPIPLYGITADGRCACGMADCAERSWGKHPIGGSWQKRATCDPDGIRDRFEHHRGNIGVYLKAGGHVLLDADDATGLATLDELPPTLRQRSGSGGHAIFTFAPHQDPSLVTDRNKVMPGIDVKTSGQFVACPSVHRSGTLYEWTVVMRPAALPDWLYERVKRHLAPVAPLAPAETPDALLKRAEAYIAKIPPAISGSKGHDQCFAAARALWGWVVKGLPEDQAVALLARYNATCQPPWSDRELTHKWESAKSAHSVPTLPDRPKPRLHAVGGSTPSEPPTGGGGNDGQSDTDWLAHLLWKESRNGARTVESHVENVIRVLQLAPEWQGKLRFDEFAGRVMVTDPPWDEYQRPTTAAATWTDEDGTRLCAWLRRYLHRYRFSPTVTECDRGVDVVARSHGFHPVRDYLDALVWDGTDRLASWLSLYLGAEQNEYTAMVGRWWLIGAVARIYRPGVMVRTVPILEGPQELRKSSAVRVLAGDQWFNDTPIDLGSKDAYQAIQGYWFVELAELDSLMRAEPSRSKAFFSSGIDRYRPPYGRRVVESPRQCIFVGTVNPPYEYLDDPSGGTRYWPIRCTHIDLEGLAAARDQLWAEATARFRDGALWYPVAQSERQVLGEEQDDRAKKDVWTETIEKYVKRTMLRRTTPLELLESALKLDAKDMTRAAQTRVGTIMMQQLGWLKMRRRDGNRRWYEYVSPEAGPTLWSDLGPTS